MAPTLLRPLRRAPPLLGGKARIVADRREILVRLRMLAQPRGAVGCDRQLVERSLAVTRERFDTRELVVQDRGVFLLEPFLEDAAGLVVVAFAHRRQRR